MSLSEIGFGLETYPLAKTGHALLIFSKAPKNPNESSRNYGEGYGIALAAPLFVPS